MSKKKHYVSRLFRCDRDRWAAAKNIGDALPGLEISFIGDNLLGLAVPRSQAALAFERLRPILKNMTELVLAPEGHA